MCILKSSILQVCNAGVWYNFGIDFCCYDWSVFVYLNVMAEKNKNSKDVIFNFCG